MQFSEILSSIDQVGDDFQATVTDNWLQGRATFGGLVAAVGNEAMRKLVPRDRPLRSLQTTFVGPAGAGIWRLRARVLRVGRAVTLAQCEVLDGDQVVALQVGVYGMDRESAVLVKPAAVEPPRKVEDINEIRYSPDRFPAFVQHFALRYAMGAKPFTSTHSPTKVFIRHRDPAPLTESAIVGLVDCIPTPALSMYKAPAPGSSLVWMLEFFEHDLEFAPDAWWRIDSDIDAATSGYVNQTGLLHDPNGRPVALSRQLFAIFG
ncbi:acyl-CoA thioesterase [Steroidobacter sp.]|uniref:acyl-CoA thioesterase n=1 Tax=Steroidobacter sp. TaxID=1978227 RepID=UPI001A5646FE|nr:thioesterase family protein [Steroidobacter sp.]MBL8265876.1 thioesterase family protein [Steroidobacter sp.]